MFTGQLSLSGPIDSAGQKVTPNGIADAEAGEATFALLFESALELSAMDCSAADTPSTPFDADLDTGDLPASLSSIRLGTTAGSASLSPLLAPVGHPLPVAATDSKLNDWQSDGNLASQPGFTGTINKDELSNWMDAHALTHSSHRCAMYCRMGMEAAGLNTADRPLSGDAGDYGPFLMRHGAQAVSQDSYVPQVGDVVVFDKTSQHPFGHIQMYDGHHWVSDFVQHGISPYNDADSAPPFTIYRFA